MAKKKNPKKPRFSKKREFYVLAALIAILLGIFLVRAYVHTRQVNKQYAADKIRFAAAEGDISGAYTSVVQTLGQPYEAKLFKACSYGALKFARGSLSCEVEQAFVYGVNSLDDSKAQASQVLGLINGKYGFSKQEPNWGNDDFDRQGGQFTLYTDDMHGLSCTLDHDTYTKSQYTIFGKDTYGFTKDAANDYMSAYTLSCDKFAAKPVYHLDH